MGILIDSSILIAAERGKFDLKSVSLAYSSELFFISAITYSELLHGLERAKDPAIKLKRSNFIEDVLRGLAILPFGVLDAQTHAAIWASLRERGRMIGLHDLLIAATARHGFKMATLNEKEFGAVPDLELASVASFLIHPSAIGGRRSAASDEGSGG